LGLIGAFCLIVWATFILAMQVIIIHFIFKIRCPAKKKKTILIKLN
jgi:hypothetical protein